MDRLKGKRAVITGGTTGIGLATARQFMQEGARVMVTGLNEVTLASARASLGSEAAVVQLDAGSPKAVSYTHLTLPTKRIV